MRELEKKIKKEEAQAAKAASLVVSDLTMDKEITKPLKESIGLSDSKCNVQKYASIEAFKEALKEDEVNFKFPFIISNAADNLESLQKTWNSKNLKKDSETRFRYFAPH